MGGVWEFGGGGFSSVGDLGRWEGGGLVGCSIEELAGLDVGSGAITMSVVVAIRDGVFGRRGKMSVPERGSVGAMGLIGSSAWRDKRGDEWVIDVWLFARPHLSTHQGVIVAVDDALSEKGCLAAW